MSDLTKSFEERLVEVNAYVDLLRDLDRQSKDRAPRFQGSDQPISPQQQKLLLAGVYLHLYNLVEATMTRCVDAVAGAAAQDGSWKPVDLTEDVRNEWVRSTARTHQALSEDNRLKAAVRVVELVISDAPVETFEIDRGGGGNWDHDGITAIASRIGMALAIRKEVLTAVMRHVKDDWGALTMVKNMRNALAHGELSFTESVDQMTIEQLVELADAVTAYLREVVEQYSTYLSRHEFLAIESRPSDPKAA